MLLEVTCKAAACAQRSRAGVGPLVDPGVDVKRKGIVGGTKFREQRWSLAEEESSDAERIC